MPPQQPQILPLQSTVCYTLELAQPVRRPGQTLSSRARRRNFGNWSRPLLLSCNVSRTSIVSSSR